MWAAYVLYPAYRAKNGHVNTLAERLQGCFRYSMNGKPPAADDPVLTALQTYMFWLASKAPTGVTLEGQGYRSYPRRRRRPTTCVAKRFTPSTAPCAMALKARARRTASTGSSPPYGGGLVQLGRGHAPDRQRGRFHQGQHAAGTGRHAERPEAWDVAYFMNAHERPQDPRYAESVAATRAKYHDSDDSLYGIEVNGHLLGSDSRARRQAVAGGQALNAARQRVSPRRAARFVILAVSASHARHLFMHANSGNVFMVVAPSGAGKSRVRALLQQDPSILLGFLHHARRVPAKKTVANIASWRSTISSACATIRPCWNGPRCMAISTARPRPHRRRHPRRTRCAARDRLAGRAPSSSAFRAPSAFSSCRRRSRNSKPGSRRAARTSRKSSRAGSWRRAVKSRTLRNANMLLLIKNLA